METCNRCIGHPGFYESHGAYEYCAVCRLADYNNQKVRYGLTSWTGWNIENGPIPNELIIVSTELIKPSIKPSISEIGYKFIDLDLKSYHGHRSRKPWKLGQARYVSKEPLEMCSHGFHSSDTPSDAYSYVTGSRVVMRVTRLGEMYEDKTNNQKVVSRGMRPLAIAWVGDLIKALQEIHKIIDEGQFNLLVINRLNLNPIDYRLQLEKNLKGLISIKNELIRFQNNPKKK